MARTVSNNLTRRSVVAGLTLTAVPVSALLAEPDWAHAQAKETTSEKSLYERLGGVFAIAAVVDHFSDAVVKNPIVGQKSKNPQLREWHTKNLQRLPGLKFMRTLWVCNVSGDPSSSRLPGRARRRSVLRRPTGAFASLPQNSMKWQRSLDERLISRKSRSVRRPKFWRHLPPTRTRSPPAMWRPTSEAEAFCVSQSGQPPARLGVVAGSPGTAPLVALSQWKREVFHGLRECLYPGAAGAEIRRPVPRFRRHPPLSLIHI